MLQNFRHFRSRELTLNACLRLNRDWGMKQQMHFEMRRRMQKAEGRRLAPDAQYFLVREQEKNEKRKFSMQIFFGEREREIVMDQRFKMERPRRKNSNLYSNKTLYLHNFNVWHSRNRVEHKSCIHFGVVNIYHSQHLYESQSHK